MKKSKTIRASGVRKGTTKKPDAGTNRNSAIPMMAGPGSIITVMVFMGQTESIFEAIAVLAYIIIVVFIAYFLLLESKHIVKRIGKIGIQTSMRVMGMIIGSIGIQTLVNSAIEFSHLV